MAPDCVWAMGVCGATVQTFWELNSQNKQLSFKHLARHGEQICDPESLTNQNAVVELLDRKHEVVRRVPAFIQLLKYSDTLGSSHKLQGAVEIPKTVIIQLKFADGRDFAQIHSLKILFLSGEIYGPANF